MIPLLVVFSWFPLLTLAILPRAANLYRFFSPLLRLGSINLNVNQPTNGYSLPEDMYRPREPPQPSYDHKGRAFLAPRHSSMYNKNSSPSEPVQPKPPSQSQKPWSWMNDPNSQVEQTGSQNSQTTRQVRSWVTPNYGLSESSQDTPQSDFNGSGGGGLYDSSGEFDVYARPIQPTRPAYYQTSATPKATPHYQTAPPRTQPPVQPRPQLNPPARPNPHFQTSAPPKATPHYQTAPPRGTPRPQLTPGNSARTLTPADLEYFRQTGESAEFFRSLGQVPHYQGVDGPGWFTFTPGEFPWPVINYIGDRWCMSGEDMHGRMNTVVNAGFEICPHCRQCTPSDSFFRRSDGEYDTAGKVCTTPCGQARIVFDTLIKGDMWGPITRMKNFQSMRAHLNLPGVWLFAVKPDHVFLLETDGKGFFKLFQSYNSLYSVYYWLGKQDHELCGLYNSHARLRHHAGLNMTEVELARNNYGRNQIIFDIHKFIDDLESTIDSASVMLVEQDAHSLVDLWVNHDPYLLPSMYWIFGGPLINYMNIIDRRIKRMHVHIFFKEYRTGNRFFNDKARW